MVRVYLILVFSVSFTAQAQRPLYLSATERAGISPGVFSQFLEQTRSLKANKAQVGAPCFEEFQDSIAGRDALLKCLADHKEHVFNTATFKSLFDGRIVRLPEKYSNPEYLKTMILFGFLEDLIRERLQRTFPKEHYAWYHKEKGFLTDLKHYEDFEYENGDVLITMGHSSVSSMITAITDPPSRYSHAVLIETKTGRTPLHTYEAVIEAGLMKREYDGFKGFIHENYAQVGVLRVKAESHDQRKALAQAAVNYSKQKYEEGTSYDIKMNMDDESEMFCSELAIIAYKKALESAGKTFSSYLDLVHEPSTIRSPRAIEFAKTIGIDSEKMVSPADLQASRYFETIAEYRDISRLVDTYLSFLFGEEFFQRITSGFELRYSVDYYVAQGLVSAIDGVTQAAGWVARKDWVVLPENIDSGAVRRLMMIELQYKRVLKRIKKFLEKNGREFTLQEVSPHEISIYLREAMDTPTVRRRIASKLD